MEIIIITILAAFSVILFIWEMIIWQRSKSETEGKELEFYRKRFVRRTKMAISLLIALLLIEFGDFFPFFHISTITKIFLLLTSLILIFYVVLLVLQDLSEIGKNAIQNHVKISSESMLKFENEIGKRIKQKDTDKKL